LLQCPLGVVVPVSFFEKDGPRYYNSLAMIDADGQVFYGQSFLADHRGELVAELPSGVEGVATAGFELDTIAKTRAYGARPRCSCARMSEVFGSLSNPTNGSSISTISRIAPAPESAQIRSTAMTVLLRGA